MNSSRLLRVEAPLEWAGLRIDKALATLPEISSRSRAQQLIQDGLVLQSGKAVKASSVVQTGNVFEIQIPESQAASPLTPLDQPLSILYQDEDLLVINKPSGLVVHPAAGHAADTLVNILAHHVKDLSMGFAEHRPGIVHRLDKDTSGLLVVAKNDFAQQALVAQFKARTVRRRYWAICYGRPAKSKGTIESHLRRHPQDRKRFASDGSEPPLGKRAVTHYELLKTHSSGLSWLECRLETGRTHQIRVHLSEMSHPLVGDLLYGRAARAKKVNSTSLKEQLAGLNRLGLHAFELGFQHPRSSEMLVFSAPWPENLEKLVMQLGFHHGS